MFFSKRKIIFLVLLLSLLISLSASSIVKAAECDDKSGQTKVDCLQNKVNDLKGQGKTLSSQISIMDSQINLTEARIEANKREILDLSLDIDTATKKINILQDSLKKITEVWVKRVVVSYQAGGAKPIEIFLSSGDASSLLARLNYLRIVKRNDEKLIVEVQQAKTDYTNQKDIFEEKKKKVESLKAQLEAYTMQLAQEKQNKQSLLNITKNDESRYQSLLDEAKRELAGLTNSQFTGKKDVKRGDVIGLMGSTGFSTGPHLHFGYYDLTEEAHNNDFQGNIGWYSARDINPEEALQNKSLTFEAYSCNDVQVRQVKGIGNGSLLWPLENPYITQCYGNTPYSYVYSNNFHEGLDMATKGSVAISAIDDGVAYFYRGNSSFGNNVRIFHSNGKMSLYLHMQ